jgi:alpha-amylase/alpha-mannosidase (GH57 family)
MNRSLCIHGHFYQPPRENPWLEAVELEDSAAPYHDWNERVLAECYAPNAVSRILDDKGRIRKIVNNYSNISFDFGPTLLSWLEENAESVYQALLMADWESVQRFSGHGSAMAQAYNHLILPLAARRDKLTQIVWGLQDFESRFGRAAEGMWLPETAVDLETLDLLAEHGINFTILAPHQALRIRPKERAEWQDANGGTLDITRPYEVDLPSGRTIAVFFYHGALASAVSFEGLLSNGDAFAKRLIDAFPAEDSEPRLVHLATDGEAYGHHHRFGDMALAYALHKVEEEQQASLTNYGEYLEKNPPRWKAQIAENTSWSCPHGVERWRSDCGCRTGQHPEWNQAWRTPLREALDMVRDELAPLYEKEGAKYFSDPWQARDQYIRVILDRANDSLARFFQHQAAHELTGEEIPRALKLLEMQRHILLMFTSCGWYFDDLAGIEAQQNLQYASRAIQLAQELFGDGIEERFLRRLEAARSNEKGAPDGRVIYERTARAARVDLSQVAAHYAAASIFETYTDRTRLFCYRVERHAYRNYEAGRAKLAVGQATVTSEITRESARLCYGMLHFGDQNFSGGVGAWRGDGEYEAMERSLSAVFLRGDFPEVIRSFNQYFGGMSYSLKSLFRDEQRKILSVVIQENLSDAEAVYSQLYENHAPLMRFLMNLGMPLPRAFQSAATVALNGQLRRAMAARPLDIDHLRGLLEEVQASKIELDAEVLGYTLKNTIGRLAGDLFTEPEDLSRLRSLQQAAELARSLPFWVDLWKAQNVYYEILQNTFPKLQKQARGEGKSDPDWVKEFLALGDLLMVRTGEERSGNKSS